MTVPCISRRALGARIASLGIPGVAHRAHAAAPRTIRVGYLKSLSPLSLGRVRGSLEATLHAKGYTLEWVGPFAAFAPAVEALIPGSIDVTVGSSTSAVSAMVARAPLKIITFAPPPGDTEGILARPDSKITRVADLIGKKAAVNRGGTGEYLLAKALANEGIARDKVETVYLGPADAAYAFSTGNVDAWAVWDPYVAIAQVRDHARMVAGSVEIGSENATIIVVRNGFLAEDPAAVRQVYDAVLAENRWGNENPRAAAELFGKDARLDGAVIDLLARRQPAIHGPVNDAVTASLERVAQWFYDQKIIPALPRVRDFVYDVPRASPS